jgi:hypothetical protein
MKQLVTFADPEKAIATYLGTCDLGAAVTIDSSFPSTSLAGTARWVQVELDGTPGTPYYLEQPTIRVVAWAPNGKRSDVKALASLLRGHLLRHPGDDDVCGVKSLVGRSAVGTDPDTKNLSCWGTVRVSLRPHPAP